MTEIEFEGVNGMQLFVKSSDVEVLVREIGRYVGKHGCQGIFEAVDDRIDALDERREERSFVIAPEERGWLTVWEDGVWADRRLACHLSQELGTSVYWLMVSSASDSWAFFAYESGRQVDTAFEHTDDAVAAARAFAERQKLPHALSYLSDPNAGSLLDRSVLHDLGIDPEALATQRSLARDAEPEGLVRETWPCASGRGTRRNT